MFWFYFFNKDKTGFPILTIHFLLNGTAWSFILEAQKKKYLKGFCVFVVHIK